MSEHAIVPIVQLAVPGPWRQRDDLIEALRQSSGGRLAMAGNGLVDMERNVQAEYDFAEHVDMMETMFELGGRLEDDALDAIAEHEGVLYVRLRGGREHVGAVMRLGCDLLDAGGLGVRVDSSGRAHSPQQWRDLAREATSAEDDVTRGLALYRAFTVLVGPDEEDEDDVSDDTSAQADEPGGDFTSFGMHVLGLRDAAIADLDELQDDPIDVLEQFLLEQVARSTNLQDGDTFGLAQSAPRYHLRAEPDRRSPHDDPFFNPIGLWRLELAK